MQTEDSRRDSGFTLIELTVSVAISVIVLGGVGMMANASHSSLDMIGNTHRAELGIERALSLLGEDLKKASISGIEINQTGQDFDSINLQIPNPDNSDGTIQWGYKDENGTFRQGWEAHYHVSQGVFNLEVRDSSNTLQWRTVLCTGCDSTLVNEKGLSISASGSLITINLNVMQVLNNGDILRRDQSLVVNVLNP